MKVKLLAAAIITLALGVSTANAQVKQTAKNQRQRVRQGVKSGELTKAETVNILKDEKEIKQDVKAARADGVVTPVEKKEIKQDQRQVSREIYRKKHNGRVRN